MNKRPAHAYRVNGVWYRAGYRLWTKAEEARLRKEYPDTPTAQLAKAMRRSLSSVYQRARNLKLEKSAAYLASPAACRLRRKDGRDHPGSQFWFPKGHVPANKGVKRPAGWAPGRMRETQFKKGERSQNYMPIGSTRLIDGYVYRKVSDVPNVPYTVNWKPEHHLIWAKVHGQIPRGYALKFRDGDRMNTRLDNLQLITRRELMRRNTVHNLPQPLKSAIHLLGQLNRRIRERTNDASPN